MHRGYIKLWRKSLDNPCFNNPKTWVFWCYCLMKASHRKRCAMIGNQLVALNPGQFVFGRKTACHETGLSPQTIRTSLKLLSANQQITVKPTNKYSIITIINWDIYQPDTDNTNQQTTINITNKEPTDNQQITTDKNVKNVKNNNNSKSADADTEKKLSLLADSLKKSGRFLRVYTFIGKMRKLKKNINSVYHALDRLSKTLKVPPDSAWAFCTKIVEVESGNYNEQEYRQRVEQMKKDFEVWENQLNQVQ